MNIRRRVRHFIKDYMNVGFDVREDHFLTKDLGIDSDVAIYLLEDFSKEFGTDFSELDITQKFSCELAHRKVWRILKSVLLRQEALPKFEDMQVSELIEAAQAGKWSESTSFREQNI